MEHQNDWSIITRNFEEIDIRAKYFYPFKEKGYSLEVIKIQGRKINDIKNFIRSFKNSDNIIKILNINKISNYTYEITFLGDYYGMIKYIFLEKGGILKNSIVNKGFKKFEIYFHKINKEYLNEIYNDLSEKGKVIEFNPKIIDTCRYDIFGDDANLTSMERKILEFAYKKGFFEYPRKVSLEMISERFKISKTTANFHIRNGLKKYLKLILTKNPKQISF